MKILTSYIFKEFLRLFSLTLTALTSLYLIIDIVEKINNLVEHGASSSIILSYFFLEIPFIFLQMLPFATLLSTILVLSILSRSRETIAIRTLGLNPLIMVKPIMLSTLFISMTAFFLSESILPWTSESVEGIKEVWIKGKPQEVVFKQHKVWLKHSDGIYNIRLINPEKNVLEGLTFFGINNQSALTTKIYAKEVVWEDGQWIGKGVRITRFDKKKPETKYLLKMNIPLKERPEDLNALKATFRTMNIFELKNYIIKLEQEGYSAYHYRVDLYNKLSIPFASVVMALIGIPFGLKRLKGGIPSALTLSLTLGFSYWILQAVSTSLGYGDALPPIIASWLPNICFAALGGYLLIQTLNE